MKKIHSFIVLSVLSLSLTACATDMSNRDAGVITGGVVGGLLGSTVGAGTGKVVATTIGAIAGSMIGGHIGQVMDEQDHAHMMAALETGPTYEVVSWTNPDTLVVYEVIPTHTYYRQYAGHRQPCRDYITKARMNGKVQELHGKACRTTEGIWRIAR